MITLNPFDKDPLTFAIIEEIENEQEENEDEEDEDNN